MKKLFTICIFSILSACTQKPLSNLEQSKATSVDGSTKSNAINKNQFKDPPVKTVLNFLKWYRNNFSRLNKIELVKNCTGVYDSTKFYSVNYTGTEKYLTELKKSGFISDKYILVWREYFKKRDVNFKKNPQNDGSPEGFETDFITWTQEYEETLRNIDNMKIIQKEVNNDKAIVLIDLLGMHLNYLLTKNGDKWLIDEIQNKTNQY